MEKSTLIAIIAAIVVIAVAAAAAFVLTNNNGNNGNNSGDNSGDNNDDTWQPKDYGSWEPASTDVGLLTVFGNANGDSVINKDDVALIQKAIPLYSNLTAAKAEKSTADKGTDESAKATAAAKVTAAQAALDACLPAVLDASWTYKGNKIAYYLADANCDGKIDALDSALVNKIITIQGAVHNYNKGDNTKAISSNQLISLGIERVNVYFYDVDSVLASFQYPLTGDMAIGYKSNYESILICDANSRCTYACNQVSDSSSSYYKWYHPYYADAKPIGSRFTPDYEVFINSGAPQMFLSGTRAWFDENMETTLAPLGVSVVRLPFWEDNTCESSVVTLGFLICCQESALKYGAKVTDVLDKIEDAVADIDLEDRPLVFQSYNGTSISTMHNGIHEAVYAAGGKTPYDVGYSNGSISIEEVNLKMNPDYIGLDQYYGFLETWDVANKADSYAKMVDQLKNTDLKYIQAINQSQAYKDGDVFGFNQGTYMGPASYITIAYMFNKIYEDVSSVTLKFDVDALFADYLKSYHPEYKVDDFVVNGINAQYYNLADLIASS